ncbi:MULTISPECIES: type II toxin-antitoxin system RelE/ParE family toxin [Hyphobacterium]|uniref:Type II toxin-antitoxin system RelE/ParE family toxin n=1 Tax=Hyphobacterium vulgare TaxID=1736751 RepID=A0ABV7A165_9PROT
MTGFRLSREAASDIEAIAFYTRDRWGQAQALTSVDSLLDACHRIGEHKEIGVLIDGFEGQVRRFRSGHHILHYRVPDGVVEIMAFRHERSRGA